MKARGISLRKGFAAIRAFVARHAERLLLVLAVVLLLAMLVFLPYLSFIEGLWLSIVWSSMGAAFWGLRKAIRSWGWVRAEAVSDPKGDYSSADISAVNHLMTHWILFLAQLAWMPFALWIGTQPAAPHAGNVITPTQVIFTASLLLVEALLTGLNFGLVIRRQLLVRNVQRTGGD